MLPRSYRLPGYLIPQVLKSFKSFSNPLYTIKILPYTDPKSPSRFAFIISKKIASKAVFRNQIKRRFSHVVSQQIKHLKPGYNLVFLIKSKAVKADLKSIQTQVINSLKKLKILK